MAEMKSPNVHAKKNRNDTPRKRKGAAKELGYPVIIRAAYALGGLGSGDRKSVV